MALKTMSHSPLQLPHSALHCHYTKHKHRNPFGQKFCLWWTPLWQILSCTVWNRKPMIQNNVDQFRHILGLSFVQQNLFDMLNTFSRYQQIQAALVMEFRNTRPKITLVVITLLPNHIDLLLSPIDDWFLYQFCISRYVGKA